MKACFKINCYGSNHLMAIPKGTSSVTEGTVGKGPCNNVPQIPNTPKSLPHYIPIMNTAERSIRGEGGEQWMWGKTP